MPDRNQNNENDKKKKRKWLLLLLLLLLLLVIAGSVFAGTMMAKNRQMSDNSGDSVGGIGLTIDENAGEKAESQSNSTEDTAPGVAIPGWGSITIPAGETEITTVDFYNPEANADYYYLTFELRIKDDSSEGYEVLYSSQLVPPGQHLQKITLTRPLEAGEYEAVIHVQPYKMDEAQTPTNNADMETKLIVE